MSSQTSRKVGADGTPGAGTPGAGVGGTHQEAPSGGLAGKLAFAWAFVGIPLAYGVFETAKKAAALFS